MEKGFSCASKKPLWPLFRRKAGSLPVKWLALIVFLILAMSCTTYSTTRRPEAENIINAPIDVVWEKALEILPDERITLVYISKDDYFISARKSATFWSTSDEVSIRLIPKTEKETLMDFSAQTKW